ncbi:hypothetical protein HDV01_001553 [Terramyces sp. JEL0728]|nr:hypothetical protein HDV01_001553 [Terramyces sp. JEL0728]
MEGEEEHTETPLPFFTMAILCIVILSEPISSSILFPFVYFMVRDFKICKEQDIGYYVGFISSSFFLAQVVTSMWWGWISDRYGRRPVLLVGLIGNSITMVLFGFSHSLPWAIATRAACGFLNGNIGAAKSVLGEITDSSNRANAFALIGLCFGIGSIVGPILGGLLSDPVTNFPAVFGASVLFKENPYLLPCLCSAMITVVGFVVGYLYLPETCKNLGGYVPINANEEFYGEEVDVENESAVEGDIPEAISVPATSTGIGKAAIAVALAYALLALQDIVYIEVFRK